MRHRFRLEGYVSERSESGGRGGESLADLSRVFDDQQAAEIQDAVDTADREETAKLRERFE